ncbi:MAG: RluA family pseudouridine synthase [Burkholderiales bacterium]|jgi:23S rRNA pseudouridine955/2504/2580 synthase|nr:RluA family pseudouridine synthase [Burkholderiales bacterium]
MKELSKDSTLRQPINEDSAGQRIDNYLMRRLKGVPKSHIYRILRSGEVRVNSRRIGPDYRLQQGDELRIPPIRVAQPAERISSPAAMSFKPAVLFEDEALLVIDKPAGLAVHGGSGVSFGVIEALRQSRPGHGFLELVHRIDRETSGVLLLAKKRAALVELHRQMQDGAVSKHYFALVKGLWKERKRVVDLPLEKKVRASGERKVNVGPAGNVAVTIFRLERRVGPYSLLDAELKTGRTHQIRVHLSHLGYPILGDDKYGDFVLNKMLGKQGLKRMFLHSSRIGIRHPVNGEKVRFEAPLPPELLAFMESAKEIRTS